MYHEYLLTRQSQEIEATVVSKYSGHGWVEYQYVVNGHTYDGKTPATSTGRDFDDVSLGDKVIVHFDPTHPGVSGTAETHNAVTSTAPFLLAALVLLTIGVYVHGSRSK
jgi:hypothetical protein